MDRNEPIAAIDPVTKHLAAFWGDAAVSQELPLSGPVIESVPSFQVTKVAPRSKNEAWVYSTNGCYRISNSDVGHEFFVLSPREDSRNVELLAMLAHFHADTRFRLRLGSIVRIGEPWLNGSCDHLLISLPYPFGPKLEWSTFGNSRIHFLWALPLTPREAAFAELNGSEALEKKFDESQINYLDSQRPSVI